MGVRRASCGGVPAEAGDVLVPFAVIAAEAELLRLTQGTSSVSARE